jgi:hypothetical protein
MGDTENGSWGSRELGGFIRREEARKDREATKAHTPGPWQAIRCTFADGAEVKWFIEHDHHPRFPNARPSIAAMNGPCMLYSNAEADAHLIAAAPELLEEGKKLVAWLIHLAEKSEIESQDTRFITLAEAHRADAKNFRATAKGMQAAITKAVTP